MLQHTVYFLSALVALNSYIPFTSAVPFNSQFPAKNIMTAASATFSAEESRTTSHDLLDDMPFTHRYPSPSAVPIAKEGTTLAGESSMTPAADVLATPTRWTLPEEFTDTSPFGIDRFAFGSQNMEVVTGIPATASAASTPSDEAGVSRRATPTALPRVWTNSSSVYRLFYPSGSINPRNRPQGGAEFYATPGNLPFATASNVSLEYSVFFPADFDWVQGGKLPGLYGGHQGCSGGDSATNCFSTRLMWRKGGAGELYLYAPKDKQTPELCNAPPKSLCDAAYGLSIGRGSFHFARRSWTHVSQTVRLNTPGKQDGGFELFVNGRSVMRRDDVFYRDAPQSGGDEEQSGGEEKSSGDEEQRSGGEEQSGGEEPSSGEEQSNGNEGQSSSDEEEDDASEDQWILRRNLRAWTGVANIPPRQCPVSQVEFLFGSKDTIAIFREQSPSGTRGVQGFTKDTPVPTQIVETVTSTTTVTAIPSVLSQHTSDDVAGFSGLFFSTFFGGHDQSWASPKDQNTWFKDFGMSINA